MNDIDCLQTLFVSLISAGLRLRFGVL